MKKILILCPTKHDHRELSYKHVRQGYELIFHTYDDSKLEKILCQGIGLSKTFNPNKVIKVINDMMMFCEEKNIDGILSSEDYPGSIFASIITQKLRLPGANPALVLLCQHKYYARTVQRKFVAQETPHFKLIHPDKFNPKMFDMQFPVFIKPVKSNFSVFAYRANSIKELQSLLQATRMPQAFLDQFNWFLRNYSSYDFNADHILVEDLLKGVQTTLEGYVYNNSINILGVTDSIMFLGTISFKRFEYPSSLPQGIQDRMAAIARKLMSGIGFNNSFFNIEFMYNSKTDAVYIVEVNPRMVSQFADLYEKVDGINSYQLALSLTIGKKPQPKKRKGKFNIASSFVLRVFEDKNIVKMPDQKEIDELHKQFPDARIQLYGIQGQKLSDQFQDGKSYRYGLIHLGARDRQELLEKFEECKQLLTFEFESI